MTIHPTHDFPPPTAARWRCRNCDCSPLSGDAAMPCTSRPSQIYEDDPAALLPCDVEKDDAAG